MFSIARLTSAVALTALAAAVFVPLPWHALAGPWTGAVQLRAGEGPQASNTLEQTDVERFEQTLSAALLGWAGRLQDEGLWSQAEFLTIQALAAGRGEHRRPQPLLGAATQDAPALAMARAELQTLTGQDAFWAIAHHGGVAAPRDLAEAVAAVECWSMLAVEAANRPIMEACRTAAIHALARLAGPSTS